jgi:F-type H+-transporting ATPase subunit alpha
VSDLFFSGQRPAVDVGISVSRVGGNAQIKAMKKVAGTVKLELAQYRELAGFMQFGSDIDKETKARLDHGIVLMEIIKQRQYSPVPVEHQVMIFFAAVERYIDNLDAHRISDFEKGLYPFMDAQYPEVGKSIRETGELSSEAEQILRKGIQEYKAEFLKEE